MTKSKENRNPARTLALGSLLLAVACNALTGISDLEVPTPSAGADGGDDPNDGAVGTESDGGVRSPDGAVAADAASEAAAECPGFVLPIRTDFDQGGLGADWTTLAVSGGSAMVTNQRLELANGGAVKATRVMDPSGGIRVFGRLKVVSVPADGGILQSFAIYTRSDGTLAGNRRPSGVACVLEDRTPKLQLDDGAGGSVLASGTNLLQGPVDGRLVDFNVFDDGTKLRCAFRVSGSGDLTQVEVSSSWRPSGASSVVVQAQARANHGVEWIGVEHGIPREPTHHFEFEGFDPVNPFNDFTADHIFVPGKQWNDLSDSRPLAKSGGIFGGYGPLLDSSDGFTLGAESCCGPPYPPTEVVTFRALPFTVAFWIRADALPAPTSFFSLLGNGGPDGGFDVRLLPSGAVRATLENPPNATAVETPSPVVSPAKWVHVAVRREGPRVDLLINGVVAATAAGDGGTINLSNPRDLIAGALGGIPKYALGGGIDGVKTYDAALSTCQIRMLASPRAP